MCVCYEGGVCVCYEGGVCTVKECVLWSVCAVKEVCNVKKNNLF